MEKKIELRKTINPEDIRHKLEKGVKIDTLVHEIVTKAESEVRLLLEQGNCLTENIISNGNKAQIEEMKKILLKTEEDLYKSLGVYREIISGTIKKLRQHVSDNNKRKEINIKNDYGRINEQVVNFEKHLNKIKGRFSLKNDVENLRDNNQPDMEIGGGTEVSGEGILDKDEPMDTADQLEESVISNTGYDENMVHVDSVTEEDKNRDIVDKWFEEAVEKIEAGEFENQESAEEWFRKKWEDEGFEFGEQFEEELRALREEVFKEMGDKAFAPDSDAKAINDGDQSVSAENGSLPLDDSKKEYPLKNVDETGLTSKYRDFEIEIANKKERRKLIDSLVNNALVGYDEGDFASKIRSRLRLTDEIVKSSFAGDEDFINEAERKLEMRMSMSTAVDAHEGDGEAKNNDEAPEEQEFSVPGEVSEVKQDMESKRKAIDFFIGKIADDYANGRILRREKAEDILNDLLKKIKIPEGSELFDAAFNNLKEKLDEIGGRAETNQEGETIGLSEPGATEGIGSTSNLENEKAQEEAIIKAEKILSALENEIRRVPTGAEKMDIEEIDGKISGLETEFELMSANFENYLVGLKKSRSINRHRVYLNLGNEQDEFRARFVGLKVGLLDAWKAAREAKMENVVPVKADPAVDNSPDNLVEAADNAPEPLKIAEEALRRAGLAVSGDEFEDSLKHDFNNGSFRLKQKARRKIEEIVIKKGLDRGLTYEAKQDFIIKLIGDIESNINLAIEQEAGREFSKVFKYHGKALRATFGIGALAVCASAGLKFLGGSKIAEIAQHAAGTLQGGLSGALSGKIRSWLAPTIDKIKKDNEEKFKQIKKDMAEKWLTEEMVKTIATQEIRSAAFEQIVNKDRDMEAEFKLDNAKRIIESAGLGKDAAGNESLDGAEKEKLARAIVVLAEVYDENNKRAAELDNDKTKKKIGETGRGAIIGGAIGAATDAARYLSHNPSLAVYASGLIGGAMLGRSIDAAGAKWIKGRKERQTMERVAEIEFELQKTSESTDEDRLEKSQMLAELRAFISEGTLRGRPEQEAKARQILLDELMSGPELKNDGLIKEARQKHADKYKHLKTAAKIGAYAAGIGLGIGMGFAGKAFAEEVKGIFSPEYKTSGAGQPVDLNGKGAGGKAVPPPETSPAGNGSPESPDGVSGQEAAGSGRAGTDMTEMFPGGQPKKTDDGVLKELKRIGDSGNQTRTDDAAGAGASDKSTDPVVKNKDFRHEFEKSENKVPQPVKELKEQVRGAAEANLKEKIALGLTRKDGGIEHALKRQLKADLRGWGYEGKINDSDAVRKWCDKMAHQLALEKIYRNPKTGEMESIIDLDAHKEKRIKGKGIGVSSYVLSKQGGKPVIELFIDGKKAGAGSSAAYEYDHDGRKGTGQAADMDRGHRADKSAPHSAGEKDGLARRHHGRQQEIHRPKTGGLAEAVGAVSQPVAPETSVIRQEGAAGKDNGSQFEVRPSGRRGEHEVFQDGRKIAQISYQPSSGAPNDEITNKNIVGQMASERYATFNRLVGRSGITLEAARKAGIEIINTNPTHTNTNKLEFWAKHTDMFPVEKPELIGRYFELAHEAGGNNKFSALYHKPSFLEAFEKLQELPARFQYDKNLSADYLNIFASASHADRNVRAGGLAHLLGVDHETADKFTLKNGGKTIEVPLKNGRSIALSEKWIGKEGNEWTPENVAKTKEDVGVMGKATDDRDQLEYLLRYGPKQY